MRRGFYILSALVVLLAGCASVDTADRIPYKVKIKGARDNAVKKAIKQSTATCTMQKRPPSTVGQLRRRIENDIPRIEAALESRGYYDGTVQTVLDLEQSPARVYLKVEQGEQYRFGRVDVRFTGEPDETLLKIKPLVRRKQRVVAENVFAEQQRIVDLMKRKGYPFAKLNRRVIEVDRKSKKVNLLLEFDPGALSYYGPLVVEGLDRLPRKYIERQVPWREGRRYDSQIVHDFESKLLGTGLFGTARVTPEEPVSDTNAIPIRVALSERSRKTLSLGVNYSDVGPGARAFWEHRSIFGQGERLETSLAWNPIELEGDVKLTRPSFLDAQQSLVLDFTGTVEDPDAYSSKKARGTSMVLRDFSTHIQAGLGVGYQYSRVKQVGTDERYSHVLFPLQLMLDYRDDRLNPARGYQVFGRTIWYENTGTADSFLKSFIDGRDYHMLLERYRLTSALRLTLGSIDGADIDNVPADERFYAGGGGSIRGYEYQQVGPKVGDTPAGGDKLVEFSAELRIQPGSRVGYVAFVDGGTVYNDLLDETDSLRYGAGFGIRWFTTIGPLRADLAYPLNPDSTQVERLQFYISLGQAF